MKWKTLQHNGILFPPLYESQGIKLKIKGENVPLDLNQEEMVYQWAKKKDTPYAQDKVFQKNFTADFAKTLPSKFKKISYEDLDFSNAYKIVDKEKDLKEMMTKEEKKALAVKRKELREQLKEKFGKAKIDGNEVEVAILLILASLFFMSFTIWSFIFSISFERFTAFSYFALSRSCLIPAESESQTYFLF